MKLKEVGTVVLAVVVIAAAGYSLLLKFKPNLVKHDNFVEQYAEDWIEKQFDLEEGSLDLTPESN